MSENFAIAIDGPAASGKSTIARKLAEKLDLIFINTGGMYRSVAWAGWKRGLDVEDHEAVAGMMQQISLECAVENGRSVVSVDGVFPGEALTSPEVNSRVSKVATVPCVRECLVAKQRDFLEIGSVVMEGRDIGSVVFPDTPYKIYIDASEEVRASRREADGQSDTVAQRDKADSERKVSPLIVAEGATVIDSSEMDVEQTLEVVLEVLKHQGLTL